MTNSGAFEPLRVALHEAGIRFAVGGSWASTAFGEARFTNDVDILGEFTAETLDLFLLTIPAVFYVDAEEAKAAFQGGRPFNVIHMESILKFDFFSAAAFPLGKQELDRAVLLTGSGLSSGPVPFVSPEDILLAKLYWYRLGGEVSEVQWRDVEGVARACSGELDSEYLRQNAAKLAVSDLLSRALAVS